MLFLAVIPTQHSVLQRGFVMACLLGCVSAWAQTPWQPTRMQLCASEIGALEGAERKRLLRECLVIRADAERLIERDCRQQIRASAVAPSNEDRHELQKQCVAKALAVNYAELPRRPPSVPKATPESAAPLTVATEAGANN
jgi:hypothetical protein